MEAVDHVVGRERLPVVEGHATVRVRLDLAVQPVAAEVHVLGAEHAERQRPSVLAFFLDDEVVVDAEVAKLGGLAQRCLARVRDFL